MIINGINISQVDFDFSAQVEMVNEEANMAFCSALADMVEDALSKALASAQVERLRKEHEEVMEAERTVLAKVQEGSTQIHKLSVVICDTERLGGNSERLKGLYAQFEGQIKTLRGVLNEVVARRNQIRKDLEAAELVLAN